MSEDGGFHADAAMILDELGAILGRVDAAAPAALADRIGAAGTVFVAGAGRSGLLARCFAMRLMHLGKPVYMVGEVVTPALRAGDLLLVVSGSGETGSLVAMAAKARSLGADTALVTANAASTIARSAGTVVTLAAPTPKATGLDGFVPSRQPMGNLFEQAAFLLLETVIMALMRREGKTSDVMFIRHANLE